MFRGVKVCLKCPLLLGYRVFYKVDFCENEKVENYPVLGIPSMWPPSRIF
jgi:hypothetical protein